MQGQSIFLVGVQLLGVSGDSFNKIVLGLRVDRSRGVLSSVLSLLVRLRIVV